MATSSLVYTLSSDGTYYIIGTGFTSIADIEADATVGTNGSGLDNTWTGGVLEIPSTYNSLPVLAIAPNAFSGITNITSVIIENGLTHIGSRAFAKMETPYNTTLTNVTLPNTLTFLGGATYGQVFYGCAGFSSINLEDTLITNISRYTFYNSTSLTFVTIPSSVTSIGDYAFGLCRNLRVTIRTGVTSIGNSAFYSCTSLSSITLPDSVTSIGNSVFSSCSVLASVTLSNNLTSISAGAFSGCSKLASIVIPNGVTSIGNSAFYSCSKLTSMTIPNSVTSLGSAVFRYCSTLASVTLSNNLTSIPAQAFDGCSALTSIVIPNGVTSIGNSAFQDCTNLTSITIPSSITYIDQQAFNLSSRTVGRSLYISTIESWCAISFYDSTSSPFYSTFLPELDKLYVNNVLTTDLVIPNTVTNIRNYTFSRFSFLTSIIIPSSVTSIGSEAFYACRNITSITIPDSVTSIGYAAFYGCISLTSITIPNSVTSLGGAVFRYCSSLTSITIPNSVTILGNSAFRNCTSLTSITFDANSQLTSIDNSAFQDCTNLTSITIPSSVTNIGQDAFYNCSYLNSITVEGTTNTVTLGQFAFSSSYCPIYVYRLSYKTATNWSAYASRIQRIADSRYIDFVGGDVNSSTTLTQSIPCKIGDKLLTCVTCRSAFTAPQGWTLVASAPRITTSSYTEYMYVYSKTAESTTESFTATQASSLRIYLSIVNIIDRTYQEISSLNTSGEAQTNSTLTVTKPTSNELLYFYGFIISQSTGNAMQYQVTGDYDFYQYYGQGARLFFVYDTKAQNTTFSLTRTNSSTSGYHTLGIELIVPSQQTNKVSWGSNNIAFSLGNNKNISVSLGNILIYGGGSQPVVENAITTADGEILTDANGNYLQFSEGQPEEEYFLTFSSPNSFTLKSQQYNDNINFDTEEETETVTDNVKNWDGTIEYSTDKDTWTTWTGTSPISSASDGTNHNLYLRGIGNTYITGFEEYETDTELGTNEYNFSFTGSNISCDGNMETLLDYATVELGNHPAIADYCCHNMFKGCTNLTSIPLLGTQTLTTRCYENMFEGCTGLTSLPEDLLPSNSLAMSCYQNMFKDCTGLTTLPANLLPATTMVRNCYISMFEGCTGLATVPSGLLPATTLTDNCYGGMFRNCTSLITAPALPATTLAELCYHDMFYGCISLTTSPTLPAITLAGLCYYNMFINCSNLIKIPKLSATTLARGCYSSMFGGCSKIKLSTTQTSEYVNAYRIPDTGTGVVATDSLKDMFTSTGGTFTGTPTINTTYYTSNEVL